jgi:hypothetical protein
VNRHLRVREERKKKNVRPRTAVVESNNYTQTHAHRGLVFFTDYIFIKQLQHSVNRRTKRRMYKRRVRVCITPFHYYDYYYHSPPLYLSPCSGFRFLFLFRKLILRRSFVLCISCARETFLETIRYSLYVQVPRTVRYDKYVHGTFQLCIYTITTDCTGRLQIHVSVPLNVFIDPSRRFRCYVIRAGSRYRRATHLPRAAFSKLARTLFLVLSVFYKKNI